MICHVLTASEDLWTRLSRVQYNGPPTKSRVIPLESKICSYIVIFKLVKLYTLHIDYPSYVNYTLIKWFLK